MHQNAVCEKVMSKRVVQECRQLQARSYQLMTETDALMRKHLAALPFRAHRDIDLARQSFGKTCYLIGRACGDYPDDHSDECHCDACKKLGKP